MSAPQIERVDAIPILLTWLEHMAVAAHIDSLWTPHHAWEGLSDGQLAVLFLTFVLHARDHRLSALVDWVLAHQVSSPNLLGDHLRASLYGQMSALQAVSKQAQPRLVS